MPAGERADTVAAMSVAGPILLALTCVASPAVQAPTFTPRLSMQPVPEPAEGPLPEVPESVYGTPVLRTPGEGFNDGAIHLDLNLRYATDYVFRGIEPVEPPGSEDAVNFQTDSTISIDLGRLPDPFVRIITNTAEGDDVSNFQVIRPIVGLEWETDAFTLVGGHQSFTYPDRDDLDSSEVFARLEFNDAVLWGEEGRILGPYVLGAYDYDAFEGTYVEAGLRREGQVGSSSLSLGVEASVAYVDNFEGLFDNPNDAVTGGSGFQHYQLGLFAAYDLNQLLNISRRYGRWSITGQLNYTDGIDDELRADTQLWGGAGITLRY